MPNVAIRRMMSGWLTNGRSTSRSMPTASPYMTAMVENERDPGGHALLVQADERQRGEHHHDALREIEDAGGLVDQHEAERDQRIENAGDEAFPDRLRQQIGRRDHLREGIDEDGVKRRSMSDLMRHAEIGVDDLLIGLDLVRGRRRRSCGRIRARRRGRRGPSRRRCRARSARSSRREADWPRR